MAVVQEPLIFRTKPNTHGATDTDKVITLLVNPESLTLNFKKIITRVRTKSRIVSLYWGQEPVNFTYNGQTGNLYPTATDRADYFNKSNNSISTTIKGIEDRNKELQQTITRAENNLQLELTEEERINNLAILEKSNTELVNNKKAIQQISGITLETLEGPEESLSHTGIIGISKKYQLFKELQEFYETTRKSNELLQVIYRDYVFDGYFESFGFTDDAKYSWNWKYSLSFIILSWYKMGGPTKEFIIVPDNSDGLLRKIAEPKKTT